MLPTILFSVFLFALAGLLIFSHLWSWKQASFSTTSARDRQFAWRQFRRRMQASLLVALIAVGILGSAWIESWPLGFVLAYWLVVLSLVFWIVGLAIADMVATRFHFSKIRHDQRVEQLRLQSEARRKNPRQNGHPQSASREKQV